MDQLEAYIDGWRRHDIAAVLDTLTDDCVVIECYGPVYRGKARVEQWMNAWYGAGGTVDAWDITARDSTAERPATCSSPSGISSARGRASRVPSTARRSRGWTRGASGISASTRPRPRSTTGPAPGATRLEAPRLARVGYHRGAKSKASSAWAPPIELGGPSCVMG